MQNPEWIRLWPWVLPSSGRGVFLVFSFVFSFFLSNKIPFFHFNFLFPAWIWVAKYLVEWRELAACGCKCHSIIQNPGTLHRKTCRSVRTAPLSFILILFAGLEVPCDRVQAAIGRSWRWVTALLEQPLRRRGRENWSLLGTRKVEGGEWSSLNASLLSVRCSGRTRGIDSLAMF